MIDSEGHHSISFEKVLREHDAIPKFQERHGVKTVGQTPGRRGIDNWHELKKQYNLKVPAEELLARKHEIYREFLHASVIVMPGLLELFEILRDKPIKKAIASSSNHYNINLVLKHLQAKDFFDVLVSGDDIARGKPAPDIFLEAAKRLGTKPHNCVVLEDAGLRFEEQFDFVYGIEIERAKLLAAYDERESNYPSKPTEGYLDFFADLVVTETISGIVSSHNADRIRAEQRAIGADPDYFTFIHGSQETAPHTKPSGLVFAKATRILGELGVYADKTVYIGDDIRDFQAAYEAGWQFVGVCSGIHREEDFRNLKYFEAAGALVVPNLVEARQRLILPRAA